MKKSRKRCTVNLGRWISYAAAGAATALVASNDADATIYYSGTIDVAVSNGHAAKMSTLHSHARGFPPSPGTQTIGTFIDAGAGSKGSAKLDLNRLAFVKAAGFHATSRSGGKFNYASKLAIGVNIAGLNFPASTASHNADMAYGSFNSHSQFNHAGTGFLAFEFNMGHGLQYGWARVTMNGPPGNTYTLVDYAFGSSGQAIETGQESLVVPEPASLGLLALGAAGLLATRVPRSRKIAA